MSEFFNGIAWTAQLPGWWYVVVVIGSLAISALAVWLLVREERRMERETAMRVRLQGVKPLFLNADGVSGTRDQTFDPSHVDGGKQ
jgi:hypothetical protein